MFDKCLYFNTNHLSRVVTKLCNEAYEDFDLSASHAYLLRLVLKHPGLLQKEIGQELHLEKSTITRFIDKMVEEGYLIRKPSIIDEIKYQHIYATAKTKNIEKQLEATGMELYKNMQKALDLEQLTNFVETMRNLTVKL